MNQRIFVKGSNAYYALGKVFGVVTMILTCTCACSNFLDIGDPIDKVSANFVYSDDKAAAAVLTGIYYDLQREGGVGQGRADISTYCSLSADECSVFPSNVLYYSYYTSNNYQDFWTRLYGIIYRVNSAIEGITVSTTLSGNIKTRLLGECSFLRAFCYFYLVNFYGDIPLITTSDFKLNSSLSRTSQVNIYNQIVLDLKEAEQLLTEDYLEADIINTSMERIRPNKWCARALLSRVYLFQNKWMEAEMLASQIIDKKDLYDTVSIEEVFNKNSRESIWQLQSLSDDGLLQNTIVPYNYLPIGGIIDLTRIIFVGPMLLDAFEKDDIRKKYWIGVDTLNSIQYSYFDKYKYYPPGAPSSQYLMVLRLAEQYLIRSEARVQLGKVNEAISDLNVVRQRAHLGSINGIGKNEVMEAILQERRVELFTEWGHRWLDLKRLQLVDEVMKKASIVKEGNWASFKQWYPIPLDDLRFNKNLTQNFGYPSF